MQKHLQDFKGTIDLLVLGDLQTMSSLGVVPHPGQGVWLLTDLTREQCHIYISQDNLLGLCSYTLHRVLQLSSKLSLTTHREISLGGVTRSGSIFKLEPILKWILLLQQVHSRHY